MDELTHLDAEGRPRMVDVSDKPATRRRAVAAGCLELGPAEAEALDAVTRSPEPGAQGLKKGDPWGLARIGAINGVKRCADLIPLAHPLIVDGVTVDHAWDPASRRAWLRVEVRCEGRTGVEMEAISGASSGLLVLYDMLKAVGQDMRLGPVQLLLKEGGRRGTVTRALPGCPWGPGPDKTDFPLPPPSGPLD